MLRPRILYIAGLLSLVASACTDSVLPYNGPWEYNDNRLEVSEKLYCDGPVKSESCKCIESIEKAEPETGPRQSVIGLVVARSLCDLVDDATDGAGVYQVLSLKQCSAKYPHKTVVELGLVSRWTSDAPTRAIGYVDKGPGPDHYYENHNDPDLVVGERFGLVLGEKRSGEPLEKFYKIGKEELFRRTGSGVKNGYGLFGDRSWSMSRVGAAFGRRYAVVQDGRSCPSDIKPR